MNKYEYILTDPLIGNINNETYYEQLIPDKTIIEKIFTIFLKIFVKKTKYPLVSLFLCMLTIILNSIQYHVYDKWYLQTLYTTGDSVNIYNVMLYVYDIIGINGFISNTITIQLLLILVTYLCMMLVELNIGSIKLLYFIFGNIMFSYGISGFAVSICENNLDNVNPLVDCPYCCGSFLTISSLGFVLYIIKKNIIYRLYNILFWLLMGGVWGGCIIYDNYKNKNTCHIFLWHASNFLFGIFSGIVMSYEVKVNSIEDFS